jgi:hypothetical protein
MAQLCGIGDLDIGVEKFKIQNSKFKVQKIILNFEWIYSLTSILLRSSTTY